MVAQFIADCLPLPTSQNNYSVYSQWFRNFWLRHWLNQNICCSLANLHLLVVCNLRFSAFFRRSCLRNVGKYQHMSELIVNFSPGKCIQDFRITLFVSYLIAFRLWNLGGKKRIICYFYGHKELSSNDDHWKTLSDNLTLFLSLSIQTLTTLVLNQNQVEDSGAQCMQKLKKANSNLRISWWLKLYRPDCLQWFLWK